MFLFKKKHLFILLIVLMILVGLIGFSLSKRSNLTLIEDFVHDSVGWLQQVVNEPVNFTTTFFSNINEIKNVYSENQELKAQLEEIRQLEYENQEKTKEIEELQAILGKTESDFLQNFNAIQASVVARSKDYWFKQITINKGTQDGVGPNMAVITGEGMIGKVQTSSPFTSTVLLLNGFDRSNRISVNVDQDENAADMSGFIVGYDEETDYLLLELNENNDNLKAGQVVFSSGLGGVFPKGLEIGEVTEVTEGRYSLTKVAYVKPSADFESVHHVIVIDRGMITTEEAEAAEEESTDEVDES
ncbi:rod shape-determining protein MreC [Gracilibacillus ureilyticus]|uniref:Cell shape-determining protein MreC n=1 Tax=Gracilibacillus ureilyticus TaxID=531814 RepID=A0A1H9RQD6_9BACI|nr:rod shape-determining protein MreC [Gracilibacillus ureilyticus]SER74695.1 rod shape-determining protein MreC [Gracilibacillus ureilyticus]